MPPRKDASQAQQNASSDGIDSFELPKSIVTRLAKSALPSDAKLQKDTVMALIKGSTVFINYLAATAQDVASSRSHKTIVAADVLKALEMLEFGDLVPMLEGELELYRGGGKVDKGKGKAIDAKGKGKEKLPATTVWTETEVVSASQEPDALQEGAADLDGSREDAPENGEQEEGFDDEEMAEPEPEIEEEGDEDDDEGEGEEVVDAMLVEQEELKQDQRGLEQGGGDAGNVAPLAE